MGNGNGEVAGGASLGAATQELQLFLLLVAPSEFKSVPK